MSAEAGKPEDVEATIRTTETDVAGLGDKFADWLNRRLSTIGRPRVRNVRRPGHSGLSSISVLFDVDWTDEGGEHSASLVARLAPEDSAVPVYPGYDLRMQQEVMTLVAERTGLPVPRVWWVENSPEPLGTPFLVMEQADGVVPVDNPPYVFGGWLYEMTEVDQRAVQRAAVDVLARVHSIGDPVRSIGRWTGLGDGSSLRRHFDNERAYYEWTRRSDGLRIPVLENAFDWLEDHWPRDPSPDVLCWGDARIGNIIYNHTTPNAILDWESAVPAPRELDLGWFIFSHRQFQDIVEFFDMPGLPGMFRKSEVIEQYQQAAGVEVRDMDFYLTYAALRFGIVMAQVERRRIHFGEVEPHGNPDEYVMHHRMLAQLIAGTYEWEKR